MVCPSRATHGVSITPVTRQPRPSVWDASILWPNGLDDRVEFLTHLTHGNSNDVLGGCQNPFRGRASSCPSVFRGLPKLANNMFRIDVQYLGNAAWYGGPIWNYPSSIGWRVTFDTAWPWKDKYRSVLVTMPCTFLLLCPSTFKLLPAPLVRNVGYVLLHDIKLSISRPILFYVLPEFFTQWTALDGRSIRALWRHRQTPAKLQLRMTT